MTVLPESFPFPSPHSFSLLLVETVVSPSGVVRRGGVCVYTPPRAALRGWGSIGTRCVATPRESINRPSHHSDGKREEGEEREEGRKRKEGRGGGEKWGLKYGGAGKCTQPAHARASTPRRLASTHCL